MAAARDLLGTARHGLATAMATTVSTERYATAHLAALRAAAAVLAVPHPAAPPPGGPANVWVLLAEVAPELSEWAAFFAAGAGKRAAAEAGLSRRGHPARGRRPAPRRADLPRARRDHPRADPPAAPPRLLDRAG